MRPGIEELVNAVIEQWIKDGKPKDPGIKSWLAIKHELYMLEVKSEQHTLETNLDLIRPGSRSRKKSKD